MVILITGASHTGKTALAQRLLAKYHYPYLSIDHLKMGLIRSGHTALTPLDDEALTAYLWPILREIIKTAVENRQNLIIEGCYIPFYWQIDFDAAYLAEIRYVCLIMTPNYIRNHFEDICRHANCIESRMDDSSIGPEVLIRDNMHNWHLCQEYHCPYIEIDEHYEVDFRL